MTSDEGFVLVVDDEPDICDTLQEVIEMAGCRAVIASNGAEALAMLDTMRPCLIILDLMMPVMSGGELVAAMQQRPELAGLPILISTSAPGRAPAGLPVLAKPINIHKLWEHVRGSCTCSTRSTPSS
jgi:CheY-like chemotaxis protein